jgi:hypothetical protein
MVSILVRLSVVVSDDWCGDKWDGLDRATRWTAGDRAGLDDLEGKVRQDWSDLSKSDQERLHHELGHPVTTEDGVMGRH